MAASDGAAAVFTIASNNYLSYARTLMASAKEFAPGFERIVVLADEIAGGYGPAGEDFQLLPSSALQIPKSRWFHFRYNILELNTAVKPYALAHLLETYETVIYFDPDIVLYSDLQGIEALLSQYNIVLTPHLLRSKPDDGLLPDELTILRSGTYNLGFIGVRAGQETHRFVQWWCSKVYGHAYVDFERGLFTDQRWIDMAPGMFESVYVCREPQYNVAYWNLDERQVTRTGESYYVDGRPLCFFHFSGFDPQNPLRLSRFQTRFTAGRLGPVAPLLTGYADRLLANGYNEFRNIPYAYGRFANGSPVLDICRRYADEVPGITGQIEDPFSEAGFNAYCEYWSAHVWRTDRPDRKLTRLALRIHNTRRDLRIQMPDIFGCDYGEFMEWFVTAGVQEYRLHPLLVNPVRMLLFAHRAGDVKADDVVSRLVQSVASELPEVIRPSFARRVPEIWPLRSLTRASLIDWLNEREPAGNGMALTRVARMVYESRPDLQAAFPDVARGDVLGFLRWCLAAGAVELGLKRQFLSPLRDSLREYAASHVAPAQRVSMTVMDKARYTLAAARAALSHRNMTRPNAAAEHPDAAPPIQQAQTYVVSAVSAHGINVIGYVRSETGMGELSRSVIDGAGAARVQVSVCDYEVNNDARQQDYTAGTIQNEIRYSVNVCAVNADQTSALFETLPGDAFRNRYNIGYWAWELEDFPAQYHPAFHHYDEIWTISSFCQDAISRKAPVPVIRMPLVVYPAETAGCGREHFALRPDEFLFLSVFDLRSVFRRKNPLGAVEAFRVALSRLPDSRLLLKVNNARQFPEQMQEIRTACAGLPVTVMDNVMSRAELNDLIACCDCVVSLHRSEGFGLVLAEAMYLGKPVVTTAYSGNLDFTHPDTAFLVGGEMTEVGPDAAPYPAISRWMEPDISAAAEMLAVVRNDAQSPERIARRGQDYVRQNFSAAAVGKLIQDRLAVIRPRIERRVSERPHQ